MCSLTVENFDIITNKIYLINFINSIRAPLWGAFSQVKLAYKQIHQLENSTVLSNYFYLKHWLNRNYCFRCCWNILSGSEMDDHRKCCYLTNAVRWSSINNTYDTFDDKGPDNRTIIEPDISRSVFFARLSKQTFASCRSTGKGH